eukprot:c8430_g1_i1.p1 GENE.c8430_g1_i1~~c8430_g1_i1.p1  ORF type:complete len:1278 (+),score=415.36 c8430_g1_i1:107-3940(+)
MRASVVVCFVLFFCDLSYSSASVADPDDTIANSASDPTVTQANNRNEIEFELPTSPTASVRAVNPRTTARVATRTQFKAPPGFPSPTYPDVRRVPRNTEVDGIPSVSVPTVATTTTAASDVQSNMMSSRPATTAATTATTTPEQDAQPAYGDDSATTTSTIENTPTEFENVVPQSVSSRKPLNPVKVEQVTDATVEAPSEEDIIPKAGTTKPLIDDEVDIPEAPTTPAPPPRKGAVPPVKTVPIKVAAAGVSRLPTTTTAPSDAKEIEDESLAAAPEAEADLVHKDIAKSSTVDRYEAEIRSGDDMDPLTGVTVEEESVALPPKPHRSAKQEIEDPFEAAEDVVETVPSEVDTRESESMETAAAAAVVEEEIVSPPPRNARSAPTPREVDESQSSGGTRVGVKEDEQVFVSEEVAHEDVVVPPSRPARTATVSERTPRFENVEPAEPAETVETVTSRSAFHDRDTETGLPRISEELETRETVDEVSAPADIADDSDTANALRNGDDTHAAEVNDTHAAEVNDVSDSPVTVYADQSTKPASTATVTSETQDADDSRTAPRAPPARVSQAPREVEEESAPIPDEEPPRRSRRVPDAVDMEETGRVERTPRVNHTPVADEDESERTPSRTSTATPPQPTTTAMAASARRMDNADTQEEVSSHTATQRNRAQSESDEANVSSIPTVATTSGQEEESIPEESIPAAPATRVVSHEETDVADTKPSAPSPRSPATAAAAARGNTPTSPVTQPAHRSAAPTEDLDDQNIPTAKPTASSPVEVPVDDDTPTAPLSRSQGMSRPASPQRTDLPESAATEETPVTSREGEPENVPSALPASRGSNKPPQPPSRAHPTEEELPEVESVPVETDKNPTRDSRIYSRVSDEAVYDSSASAEPSRTQKVPTVDEDQPTHSRQTAPVDVPEPSGSQIGRTPVETVEPSDDHPTSGSDIDDSVPPRQPLFDDRSSEPQTGHQDTLDLPESTGVQREEENTHIIDESVFRNPITEDHESNVRSPPTQYEQPRHSFDAVDVPSDEPQQTVHHSDSVNTENVPSAREEEEEFKYPVDPFADREARQWGSENPEPQQQQPPAATVSDPQIAPCSQRGSCEECTASPFCGYCRSTRSCLRGDRKRSFVEICNSGWTYGTCDVENPLRLESQTIRFAVQPEVAVPEASTSISTSMGMVVVLFAVFFFYRWRSRAGQRMYYRELVPPMQPMTQDLDFSSFGGQDDGVGHTYGPDVTVPNTGDPFARDDEMEAFTTGDNGDGDEDGESNAAVWADWDRDKW